MQKILVPVDFSSFSFNAVGVAADIAKKSKAELHLLHLTENAEADSNHKINQNFLEILQLKSMSGLKIIHAVKNESISDGIQKYADQNKIDLIVMGSHGNRTTEDHIFGSNTDKVMKSISLPLLIVKESTPNFTINTVVFTSNFYGEANISFKKVKVLLDVYKPEIHLLKIITPQHFETSAYSNQLMHDFANFNNLKGYCCRTVNAKSVEEGINYYCNEANPELLIIESHGKSKLSSLLFGSISDDIVTNRKQPVLTVKIEEPEATNEVIFPA